MTSHLFTRNLSSVSYRRLVPVGWETPGWHQPFLAPWKKNRTMKTCKPAIVTIIKLSITLKLNILLSVLRTVLKLRFSRVRKYFWLRLMVDSCPESLKMDSSSADVCSGDVPCLAGSCARCSFSTWSEKKMFQHHHFRPGGGHRVSGAPYGNLEIHHLLGKGRHLIVEAESVFPRLARREDEVALSFLGALHDHLFIGAGDRVVDVK